MLPEGDPGPLAPSSYAENLLPYVRGLGERVDIVGEVYSNIDSTDMEPSHWEGLARLISDRMDDFDGFLVLHGTDTMAYTASALSFMLQNLPKPVVLTGSQRPVAELRTDARTNLIHSALCATLDIPEVTLFFGTHLFRGNCSTKVSIQSYEAFNSPNVDPLIEMGVDIQRHSPSLRPQGEFRFVEGFSRKVMVLYMFPGIRAGQLRAAVDAGAGVVRRPGHDGSSPAAPTLYRDPAGSAPRRFFRDLLASIPWCMQMTSPSALVCTHAIARAAEASSFLCRIVRP